MIYQPASHGTMGESEDGYEIGIQAIAIDNDDQVTHDADDFVLGFIGRGPAMTQSTPLNFKTFFDYDPVLIRQLKFSDLNPGFFSSNDADAQAVGGFELEVRALAPVPLPAAGWTLLAGLCALGGLTRRRSNRS